MPGDKCSLDNVPWLTTLVPFGESCSAELVNANIMFKICNKNLKDPIHIISNTTFIDYNGLQVREIEALQAPIGPGDCKRVEELPTWDPCDVNADTERSIFPMGLQLNARVINDPEDPLNEEKNVFCSCKFKQSSA